MVILVKTPLEKWSLVGGWSSTSLVGGSLVVEHFLLVGRLVEHCRRQQESTGCRWCMHTHCMYSIQTCTLHTHCILYCIVYKHAHTYTIVYTNILSAYEHTHVYYIVYTHAHTCILFCKQTFCQHTNTHMHVCMLTKCTLVAPISNISEEFPPVGSFGKNPSYPSGENRE